MNENKLTTEEKFPLPAGARKLSPLEMNKLAILKAHTVITFKS